MPQSATATRQVHKAAVLGAGTMGSRIAAHIANAGVPVVLLDIIPSGTTAGTSAHQRNKLAFTAVEALKKSKPAAFYTPENAHLITIGNFEDDLSLLAECDWIIEAVAEDIEIKRSLLDKIQQHLRPEAILTTNTSGLPIAEIAASLPAPLKLHFFGTHFFNPPRYMRLLEVVPTPDTELVDVTAISQFCDRRLGKTIVHAHDTPNFIANRIGAFSLNNAIRLMQAQGLTIEEVDALTGSVLGCPKPEPFVSAIWWASMSSLTLRETLKLRLHGSRTNVPRSPLRPLFTR